MSELSEALTAAGAAALVRKEIDPVLLEYQRRYSPIVRAITPVKHGSTVYYFNKRTVNPAGGFVTDGGARDVSSSVYVQENFTVKLLQSVGSVTGFAEAVTADEAGSLRAREIEGASKGLYWDIENAVCWGNAAATVNGPYPQFDGLDVMCASFSNSSSGGPNQGTGSGAIDNYGGASTWGAPGFSPWVDGIDQNAIDCAQNNLSLGYLDLLIDMVESNVAEPIDNADWMLAMSPAANSRIAQLLYGQQRYESVEIAAGLKVPTYRGIPIVKSSFLSSRTNKMGTVTASQAGGAGTLNATLHYVVAPVIARFGEIQASADASATATTGANGTITLAFSIPTGPEGSAPTHYKVYRGSTNNNQTLLGYVDAVFYDGTGAKWNTTSIVDNGAALVPKNGSNVPGTTPATYYNTNANMRPLTSAGEQSIYLLSRNPNYICRPYTREMKPVDIYPTTVSPDSLPFAFVADTVLAVRASKYIGRLANVRAALDVTAGSGFTPTQAFNPTYVQD